MKTTASFSYQHAGRWLKSAQPFLASFGVHAAALVILSLILLPIGRKFETHFLVSRLDPDELVDEIETLPLAASLPSSDPSAEDDRARADLSSPAQSLAIDADSLASSEAISLSYRRRSLSAVEGSKEASETDSDSADDRSRGEKRWGTIPREPSNTTAVREADSPSGALSAITTAIKRELEQGDTLVVWLADASISLQHDRVLMAEHMQTFYESINAFDRDDVRQGSELMNAVVAFGSGTKEILRPHRLGARACAALADIPIDRTGVENVMSAVQRALAKYRLSRRRRERVMIVVITDESGDDTVQLETTIRACRESHVPVHIIGPSAVLGADRGSHAWVDPASGHQYLLPVKRGPDTALAERLWLPYWHESGSPPWLKQGVQVAAATQWYGGPYRERLVSGFGPYALTRLSLQTGGSFTVLDRQADRSRFRLEDLRDYVPQYTSLREYEDSVRDRPLRLAVSRVAALTMQPRIAATLTPPRMVFMGMRDHRYPFAARIVHVEPGAFPQRLMAALRFEDQAVAAKLKVLRQLLTAFDAQAIDWEREYSREESSRWRAWYDLTKGRLLASLVRCMEYRSACNELPNRLARGINHVALHDSPTLVVPASESLAKEAAGLLKRCADRNPNTPWAYLARWELDRGLGLRFTWSVVPRPRRGPVAGARRSNVPNFPRL